MIIYEFDLSIFCMVVYSFFINWREYIKLHYFLNNIITTIWNGFNAKEIQTNVFKTIKIRISTIKHSDINLQK